MTKRKVNPDMNGRIFQNSNFSEWFVKLLLDIPWIDILAEVWKLTRHLWQGLADEGIYEVLEYESTLELLDNKGRSARFQKREQVRYRQNNIIAYQDHAWGDGEILLNYRCAPGLVVDRYHPGQKTFLLISLREPKRRNRVDEFNIDWAIKNGFIRSEELWETEIKHRTKQLKVRILFPESRPPKAVSVVEQLRRRRRQLGPESIRRLADGRWSVSWKSIRPRLNERYQLHWEW